MNRDDHVAATGHGEKYSRKNEEVISRLLTAPTQREAARQAGVSEKTVSRWRKKPDFQERLEEAQRRLFDETVSAVAQAGPTAVDILLQVARHTLTKDLDRVRAAKAILDTVCKLRKAAIDSREREMAPDEEWVEAPEHGESPATAHELDYERADNRQGADPEEGNGTPDEEEPRVPEAQPTPGCAGTERSDESPEHPSRTTPRKGGIIRRTQMSPDVRKNDNVDTQGAAGRPRRRLREEVS